MVNDLKYKNVTNWMTERSIVENNGLMLSVTLDYIYYINVTSKRSKYYNPYNDHDIYVHHHDFEQRVMILGKFCVSIKAYDCLHVIVQIMNRYELTSNYTLWSMVNKAYKLRDYTALDMILSDELITLGPDEFYKIIKGRLRCAVIIEDLRMFSYLINHFVNKFHKHNNNSFIKMALKLKHQEIITITIETYDFKKKSDVSQHEYDKFCKMSHDLPEDLESYVQDFLKQFNIV
jgi:hypothetical protein